MAKKTDPDTGEPAEGEGRLEECLQRIEERLSEIETRLGVLEERQDRAEKKLAKWFH